MVRNVDGQSKLHDQKLTYSRKQSKWTDRPTAIFSDRAGATVAAEHAELFKSAKKQHTTSSTPTAKTSQHVGGRHPTSMSSTAVPGDRNMDEDDGTTRSALHHGAAGTAGSQHTMTRHALREPSPDRISAGGSTDWQHQRQRPERLARTTSSTRATTSLRKSTT